MKYRRDQKARRGTPRLWTFLTSVTPRRESPATQDRHVLGAYSKVARQCHAWGTNVVTTLKLL
jgi:hypothetical protein